MGRLGYRKLAKKIIRVVKPWLLPVLIASILFMTGYKIFEPKVPSKAALSDYLKKGSLKVKAEPIDGYQQVYYLYNDVKVYVSSGEQNHTNPSIGDEYITWLEPINGSSQVILYNLLDKTRTQLSFSGSNGFPRTSKGRVVWQRIIDEKPQIYLYDGVIVKQLTKDYSSTKADIKDDTVIFTQELAEGKWKTVSYNVVNEQQTTIAEGDISISYPHFVGDQIKVHLYEQ